MARPGLVGVLFPETPRDYSKIFQRRPKIPDNPKIEPAVKPEAAQDPPKTDNPGRPPKAWWDKVHKKAMAEYNDKDTADKVTGDIWANLPQNKREEIIKRHE